MSLRIPSEILADPTLSHTDVLVFAYVSEHPMATNKQIADALHTTTRTVQRSLASLKRGDRAVTPYVGSERRIYAVGYDTTVTPHDTAVTPPRAYARVASAPAAARKGPAVPVPVPEPELQLTEQPNTSEKQKLASLAGFKEVWLASRRGAKRLALIAYRKAVPSKVTHEELLKARREHVAAAREPRFVKHLERWIRDEQWLEDLSPEKSYDPALQPPQRLAL